MATVPLDVLTHRSGTGGPLVDALGNAATDVPLAVVGVLLAVHRPRNPIGWLLLAIEFFGASPTSQYAVLDYRMHQGTLPLGPAALVVGGDWPMFLVLISILLWVFPDGELPGGRWRAVSVALLVAGLLVGLAGLVPGTVAVITNRVRVDASGNLAVTMGPVADLTMVALVASWLVWLALQVPRYRRSRGVRRQQLKWLYSGAAVFVIAVLLAVIIIPLALGDGAGSGPPWVSDLGGFGAALLPVCIGIALLRYRLYEIDRLITRTLAYGVVTVILGVVFVTAILGLQALLAPLTHANELAVAGSTLLVAALFQPLRRRVQGLVDRRFNRSRYDAQQALDAFSARLREEVDLETLQESLLTLVEATLEPSSVSLWLREPGAER